MGTSGQVSIVVSPLEGESDATALAVSVERAPKPLRSRATYFTFKEYLSAAEATSFFDWPHAQQVAKVAAYLEFVAQQPAAAQFTSSARASTSFAARRSSRLNAAELAGTQRPFDECATHPQDDTVLLELLDGQTKSGFGAFGTASGFLPQKELSLAVANCVPEIGHEYIVQVSKKNKQAKPKQELNSRSFYLNWCHAEKQKLLDVRQKLDARIGREAHARAWRASYWMQLVIIVDRDMCADCVQFARCLADAEQVELVIEDPMVMRVFPADKSEAVRELPIK